MIIETPLYYKATDLQTERCQVDEVVTLGHWQFEYLKNCTLDDFEFIETTVLVTAFWFSINPATTAFLLIRRAITIRDTRLTFQTQSNCSLWNSIRA